jgi:hypothetical protein
MGQGMWGTLLVLVATAAASPFSLVAFSLVLATDRGPRNGVWFILGWIVTVVAICLVSIAIGSAVTSSEGSGTTSDVTLGIQLALGAVLLMLWARRRLRVRAAISDPLQLEVEALTPAPDKPEPAWRRRIASMKAPGAFVMGGATQTWPVMIAGGAEIAHAGLTTAAAVATSIVFAVLTTAGITILEILAWRNPATAADRLHRIETYVATHRDSVLSWILLVGGVYLLGKGVFGLVG